MGFERQQGREGGREGAGAQLTVRALCKYTKLLVEP